MKKINWKLFNIALWVEIFLVYLLPFKEVDNFQSEVGFPIPFITVYNAPLSVNSMMSMNLNPLGFLVNGVIFYFVVLCIEKIYNKIEDLKSNHTK